jgi:hypothetical protein
MRVPAWECILWHEEPLSQSDVLNLLGTLSFASS